MKRRTARRGAGRAGGIAVVAAALLCGCASTRAPSGQPDPWEPVNRPVFAFNDGVDSYVLGPTSRGWIFVTAQAVRDGVSNFFFNTRFPERFLSSLGQAEGEKAAVEVGRFAVNTTLGLAGFFDVATPMGLARHDEDLGQMFGRWGVPPGPYWTVPLLGPSNPRDFTGRVLGGFLNPFWYAGSYAAPVAGVFEVVNARAQADEQIENAKRTALDYYVFVRNAYVQRREHQVRDTAEAPLSAHGDAYDYYRAPDSDEDDYYFDDEEDPLDAPAP